MKAKILFYLTLLLMPFATVSAGGNLRLKLGVDGGHDYYIGKHHDPDKVKQIGSYTNTDKETYSNYNPIFPSDDSEFLHSWYVGITGEVLFHHERFGITTGLRYIQYIDTYNPAGDYFYWNYSNEGSANYVLKGESILQRNHYIGFPLEFRYLASRPGRFCRFYFKLGSSWGFLVASDNKLNCYDSSVNDELGGYIDDVGKDPDSFVGSIYPAFGFRLLRFFPLVNIDFHLPSFMINMPASYFYYDIGMGVQLSIQLPTDRDSYDRKAPMGVPYY